MSEPSFNGIKIALQRLYPRCPDCGREVKLPRIERADGRGKSLNEMSNVDRTRQHSVTCACGTNMLARFFEEQSRWSECE